MARLRYGVILIIVVAFAGGIWTRYLNTSPVQPASLVESNPKLVYSGLQVMGTFDEPIDGLTGFEVSYPNCPHPLAILPVPALYMAIIPTEYRYRSGDYDIAYVYKGNVYRETWISYKLSLLNAYYRVQALFGLAEAKQFAYYIKIWIPSGCRALSNAEASLLERDLLDPIGQKII